MQFSGCPIPGEGTPLSPPPCPGGRLLPSPTDLSIATGCPAGIGAVSGSPLSGSMLSLSRTVTPFSPLSPPLPLPLQAPEVTGSAAPLTVTWSGGGRRPHPSLGLAFLPVRLCVQVAHSVTRPYPPSMTSSSPALGSAPSPSLSPLSRRRARVLPPFHKTPVVHESGLLLPLTVLRAASVGCHQPRACALVSRTPRG